MQQRRPLWDRLLEYWEEDEARLWLTSPQPLLGGAVPAELLAREAASSLAELHHLIDHLDDGVHV